MHIVLTGATGTVGSAVLRACLASPNITRLSILSRREFPLPTGEGLDTKKAHIVVHKDYTSYPSSVTDLLKGAEGCIWAQGISSTQVSKPEYIRITYDYPLAAAKAFSTLSENNKFNFVYVSGEGADPTEKGTALFSKIKGRTEVALRALPSTPSYSALNIFNVRPGYVDPTAEQRSTLSLTKRMLTGVAGPIFRVLVPDKVSPADILANVLVDLATGDGKPVPPGVGVEDEGRLVRSVGVRRMSGL